MYMKNFITVLLLMLASFIGYSQDTTTVNSVTVKLDTIYPQPLISNGKVIGILFTENQAQKIDNDYELFSLMDSIITQYGLTDSITVGVIDAQGKKITQLELQIDNYKVMLNDKDNMINNRNSVISELKRKIELQEEQIKLQQDKEASYEEERKVLKREIRKQKTQKIVGFITTGMVAVGIVVISILTK